MQVIQAKVPETKFVTNNQVKFIQKNQSKIFD